MRSTASEAGYAIIEMLVSLLIMGMVSVMMISGFSAGRRVWERTDSQTHAAEIVGGAQMLLRQRLEHIFPVTQFDTMPPGVDFDGQSNSLTFIAPPRAAQSPSALRRYKLWLSPRGELVISSLSTVALDPKGAADENLVLLSGVQALDISYFGMSRADVKAPGWYPDWTKKREAPNLLRIHVAFDANDTRVWPDLIVRPRTTIDSECVLNPATGGCRGRL